MPAKNIPNYLVVGDWFVDEYWFVVRHHSDVSSHAGPFHYRICSEPKDTVRDLCGAGLVTRILYELRKYNFDISDKISAIKDKIKDNEECDLQTIIDEIKGDNKCSLQTIRILNKIIQKYKLGSLIETENVELFENDKKEYQLFGLGRWNFRDDDILKHFVHAQCQTDSKVVQASFSLSPMNPNECRQKIDAEIKNLEKNNSEYATTRCIRAYSFVSNEYKQLHRIDWELVPSVENKLLIPSSEPWDKSFSAVIVDDHKKGVINQGLVEQIQKKLLDTIQKEPPDTMWFVRTKNNRIRQTDKAQWPDWLKLLIGINKPEHELKHKLELLAVGPEIACRPYPINGLLTKDNHLAEHAYTLIDTLIGGEGYKERKLKM